MMGGGVDCIRDVKNKIHGLLVKLGGDSDIVVIAKQIVLERVNESNLLLSN